MQDWAGKRYWLVGASEGLGRALAHALSRAGVEVVVSGRNAERLEELADSLPGKAVPLAMDVSDMASVRAAAEAAGPLDGIVYLAGAYWPFPAQKWDPEQAAIMGDVNFTGALRVLGCVVPGMATAGRGHVVIIGSLSGFRGLPGSIGYGSAKAGLMHLAESMYADLRRSGVKVQLANPGFIRTRLTELNDFHMPQIMEPEDAAQRIFDHMQTDRFKTSFPNPFGWVFRGGQFLPDGLWYGLFGKGG